MSVTEIERLYLIAAKYIIIVKCSSEKKCSWELEQFVSLLLSIKLTQNQAELWVVYLWFFHWIIFTFYSLLVFLFHGCSVMVLFLYSFLPERLTVLGRNLWFAFHFEYFSCTFPHSSCSAVLCFNKYWKMFWHLKRRLLESLYLSSCKCWLWFVLKEI